MPFRIHFDDPPAGALKDRSLIAEIARPFFGEDDRAARRERYKEYWEAIDPDASLESADIAALPLVWNYYTQSGQVARAQDFVARAAEARKPCAVFGIGDRNPHINAAPVVIFGASLYRSRTGKNPQHAVPTFLSDELSIQTLDELPIRHKGKKPVVGFCGQASASPPQIIGLGLRNIVATLQEQLGRAQNEAPPLMPHLLLRSRALRLAQNSSRIETNFLIRSRYLGTEVRATQANAAELRQEYLKNITDSDYTICVRGAGNFSKRLYEVLCLGRIPVFINTDCLLPFESEIDWKQYCVWVEEDELDQIGNIVADFHDRLSDAEFVDLQRRCRQLWQNWLTQRGFILNFPRHFA